MTPDPSLPGVVAVLEEGIAAGLHFGAQVCVRLGGKTVADFALGEAWPGRPLRADDLMAWMSACKPAAALGIARLAEAGVLQWDDPVARHLPAFAAGGKEGVTLRHVLTHTGGFRSAVDLGWSADPWDAIVGRVCAARLERDWVPGQQAAYHVASGWYVLGEIIRRLGGSAFDRFVRREVFEPLGMADAWIGMPPAAYAARAERWAPLYDTSGGVPQRQEFWQGEAAAGRCVPGAGGRGPMRDLARLYQMLIDGGRKEGGFFLATGTVEEICRIQRRGLYDQTFRHTIDWGLGVIVDSKRYGAETVPYGYGPHASSRAFGHGGRQAVCAFADPEYGLVVAAAFNGMPGEARHHRRNLALAGAVFQDLGLA